MRKREPILGDDDQYAPPKRRTCAGCAAVVCFGSAQNDCLSCSSVRVLPSARGCSKALPLMSRPYREGQRAATDVGIAEGMSCFSLMNARINGNQRKRKCVLKNRIGSLRSEPMKPLAKISAATTKRRSST